MKTLRIILLFSGICHLASVLRAQKVELQMSPKPAITVNGNNCSIWNTIWSCVTRVCDSVVITACDSVEFCTSTEVYLNTDTAYWIEWNFPGSNFPDSVYHHYPYQTPHCIYPRWDVPGDYYCDIYYNGWLSAYPNSDCYAQGPSHWIVHVQVDPNPNGVILHDVNEVSVLPNPSNGMFELKNFEPDDELWITDISGRMIFSGNHVGEWIDLSPYANGVYILTMKTDKGTIQKKLVKE